MSTPRSHFLVLCLCCSDGQDSRWCSCSTAFYLDPSGPCPGPWEGFFLDGDFSKVPRADAPYPSTRGNTGDSELSSHTSAVNIRRQQGPFSVRRGAGRPSPAARSCSHECLHCSAPWGRKWEAFPQEPGCFPMRTPVLWAQSWAGPPFLPGSRAGPRWLAAWSGGLSACFSLGSLEPVQNGESLHTWPVLPPPPTGGRSPLLPQASIS